MRTRYYICFLGILLWVSWSSGAVLRPYYNFLVRDGYEARYEGWTESSGEVFPGTWIYRVDAESPGGRVVRSRLTSRALFEGGVEVETAMRFWVDHAGAHWMGMDGESVTPLPRGGSVTTRSVTEVTGPWGRDRVLYFPVIARVPGSFSWQAPVRTTISHGGSFSGMGSETVMEYEMGAALWFVRRETVVVPAGSFRCLRVEIVEAQGRSFQRDVMWMARNVGYVRFESELRLAEEDLGGMELEGLREYFDGLGESYLRSRSVFELTELPGGVVEEPAWERFAVGAVPTGGVWWHSPFFGFFAETGVDGWWYHQGFGFMSPFAAEGDEQFWVYTDVGGLGVFYLDAGSVWLDGKGDPEGWLYVPGRAAWVYFMVDSAGGLLWLNWDGEEWEWAGYL